MPPVIAKKINTVMPGIVETLLQGTRKVAVDCALRIFGNPAHNPVLPQQDQ